VRWSSSNSRRPEFAVGYPKARIVRPNGDLRARGVTPDIAIRTPAVETPADEVLQRAVVIAREH
jgi:C-terminal processing protease CtpA/Prc